ncbi:S-DNA-T family DNA segregation ATPase FtsK/SpoIIIE [Oikeobacillus pervagus]|uniref:S-DNA-T family DNA segregation ATPase FtsK/SpoIIIE n=1 Tax=Oikeobacillus pervagus TaxID=1325931 RepID=A0AAJ1WIV2_9BACI|nr:DNA translocase FtsK [Oikeobacillus pervagus]MDQ0215040.1 S-DNA-T family DNA segregation ATPase FtsK/SpoIIIE [Oikeobacillus pervagus]
MNWFKNLFNRSRHEDESEDFEQENVRNGHDDSNHHEHQEKHRSNDVEARMVFQYPKGNFRFPVIPDDKKERSARRKRQQSGVEEQVAPLYSQETRKIKKTNTALPNKPKQKEFRSKKPFRPTEIPSPIYGFHKNNLKKQKEQTEYELKDSFLRKNHLDHKSRKEELIQKQVAEEMAATLSTQQLTEKEPVVSTDQEERQTKKTEETLSRYDLEQNEGILMDKQEEIQKSDGLSTIKEVEDLIDSLDSSLEEKESIDDSDLEETYVTDKEGKERGLEGIEEIHQDSVEIHVVEDPSGHEPSHISESAKLEKEHEINESVKLEKENEINEAIDETPEEHLPEVEQQDHEFEMKEEPVEKSNIEQEQTAVHTEESTNKEEQKAVANEEKPAKKRTHLPFNVLMLKQDKRYFERKQQLNQMKEKEAKQTKEELVKEEEKEKHEDYQYPSFDFLNPPIEKNSDNRWIAEQMEVLDRTLKNFNVKANVVNVTEGPSVTRFEVQPEPGVKVNKITNLIDDIKLSLAAKDIRMEAPIPGKHTIGIEVPNKESRPVLIREIIESPVFTKSDSPLTVALGLDISGEPIITDLRKMPHGLIAGATGSGKSVCINSLLVSLLYKVSPRQLKLMLIDPKMVELAPYNGIPHLVSPVITDVKVATAALKWAVEEMDRRYELFAHSGARDLKRYNEKVEKKGNKSEYLPYIVIVIDELADLMMMSPAEVEEAICRIAQKARACGIHLIVATQRPSVDVITGLIKANIPTRIAFSVSSQADSRTILDSGGAEKLLGRGDMLFLNNGSSQSLRLQGTFVSDDEIDTVVEHVRNQLEPHYLFQQEELLQKAIVQEEEDELFMEACEFVIQQGGASTSLLQRRFHIGYNRAARLIEIMEAQGIVSEQRAGKPRDVLISLEELAEMNDTSAF